MLGYVIGDGDMVTGFRLVGVEGAEVNSVVEALETLNRALKRTDLAVIIISENLVQSPVREAVDAVRRERRSPIILELPDSLSEPRETKMSDLVSKTLGVKL